MIFKALTANRKLSFLVLILFIHLLFLINTRFTLWPEMVVYPYLVNNGFSLYQDIINPYPPFLTSFLAIFSKFFGYDSFPYQILTWVIILIIDIVIFIITKKFFQKTSYAFISTLFFIIFSVPFSINGLWFDLVQTPIILISFYYFFKFVISKRPSRENLFFSIFFLTIGFFIKQQILWLIFWFLAVLVFKFGRKTVNIFFENFYFIIPLLILLVLQLILFWQKGTLEDFLYWNYYFPFLKASKMPGYILFPTIREIIVVAALFLIFIPVLVKKKFNINLIVLTSFIMILFAYPRFDYFHLIPSLSILSISFGENFKVILRSKILAKSVFAVSLIFLMAFTVRYFTRNWTKEVRFFEKDMIVSANLLKKVVPFSAPIYIQNGPDQMLVLSDRIPVKPWIDEFPWYLEIPGLQEKVIEGIEKQNSRFIIFKPYDTGLKYELGVYRPKKITDYLDENYQNLFQISDTFWLKIRK